MLGRTLRAAASRPERPRSGPRVTGSGAWATRSAATAGSRRSGASATDGWLVATALTAAASSAVGCSTDWTLG